MGANTKPPDIPAAMEPADGQFAAAMATCASAESNAADAGEESAERALCVNELPEDEPTTHSLPRRGKEKPAGGEALPSLLLVVPGATGIPAPPSASVATVVEAAASAALSSSPTALPSGISPAAPPAEQFKFLPEASGAQAGGISSPLPPTTGNGPDELSLASMESPPQTSAAPGSANLLAGGRGMTSMAASTVKLMAGSVMAALEPGLGEQALAVSSLANADPVNSGRGASAAESSAGARGGAMASGVPARGDAAATLAAYGGGMANGAGQAFGQGADGERGSGRGGAALDDEALLAMASAGRAAKADAGGPSGPVMPLLHGGSAPSGTGAVASPVIGAVAEPVGSGGFADALADEVRVLVDPAIGNGLRSATLKLNPEHLGPLEVRVSVHEQQANIAFTAQHAVTREALDAALPRLRETLAQQGFVQVNLDVGGRGAELAQQGQAQGEAPQSRAERSMAAFGAAGAAVEAPPAIRTRRAGAHSAGRFDGYA
ncbi:MAG: hypothetical protein RJB26_1027 [Pseudomonadota bacterium]